MARRKISGATALVTGASSGIGRELAIQMARLDARVVISARRAEQLEQVACDIRSAGGQAKALPGDICSPSYRDTLLQFVRDEYGVLDILVNNAAITAFGQFNEADPQLLRDVMEVNFFAPVELSRGAIHLLQRGQRPIIVNVCSVLGHRAVPNLMEYCSSKFALHGFSDSVRAELSELGIDVLLVSPGTTQTEIFHRGLGDKKKMPAWSTFGAVMPQRVARQTVRAIRSGRHEVILSPGGKMLVWADRLTPPIMNRLVARLSRPAAEQDD